jgi:hypothetical protein
MLIGIMLAVTGLLSLIVVWLTEGLFKREAPFGEAAEYVIGLIAGVGVAALDYFVFIPGILGADTAEWFRIGGSMLEGTASAWIALWIIRQIARPPMRETKEA